MSVETADAAHRRSATAARDWIDDVVERLGSGAGDCALIVGPPGTGRSGLLATVEHRLRDAGAHVVVGPAGASPNAGTRPVVIADDLHAWPSDVVADLAARLERGQIALVGATQKRRRGRELPALIARARRSGMELERPAMSTGDVIDRAVELGVSLTPTEASHIRRRCCGASALIDVALEAVRGEDIEDPDALTELDPVAVATRIARDWHHQLLGDLDDDALDVLAVAAVGAALDPHSVSTILELEPRDAGDAVDRARGTGLLGACDRPLPELIDTLRAVVGEVRLGVLRRRVAQTVLDTGNLTADDAVRAVEAGLTGTVIVDTLRAAADEAPPERAAALLATAERGGGAPTMLRPHRARLILDTGDVVGAAALLDEVLQSGCEPGSEVADTVAVAAEVATAAGRPGHAAELFGWLGTEHLGVHRAAAVTALLGVGDRGGADTVRAAGTGPPSTLRHAEDTVIGYLLDAGDGGTSCDAVIAAWSAVGDAESLRPCVWPVFALALCRGELDGARALVEGVEAVSPGDRDVLRSWLSVLADGTDGSAAHLDDLTPATRLRAVVAGLGAARRADDRDALASRWQRVAPSVSTMQVSLHDLIVVDECRRSAARLDDADRLHRQCAAIDDLLGALGSGTAWHRAWQWSETSMPGVPAAVSAPAHVVDGPLTEREAEVARELLAGYTYREIGERLFISAKTVEHHVANIRRRLDAGSRSELLAAIREVGYR
ncbi:LuxR C-terminal-related transcriptional regulator [Gordonia sp. Z-3]|nr:LuxR C-terminal-related transcriptional regulator [Gordonia sp. (in: high G+C Gram-positive bacteria)]MED5802254.1 LuxR C-terminal-related transcriptional regulator [Gordonia sp. Z-3]